MTDITIKLRSGEYGWLHDLSEPAADEIDRLRAELEGYREANKHMAGELDDALEDARKYAEARREIARLREALGAFMEWWDTESAGPTYSHPARREGPDGEREWSAWWNNQLRLAAIAPELGRAALAPAVAK